MKLDSISFLKPEQIDTSGFHGQVDPRPHRLPFCSHLSTSSGYLAIRLIRVHFPMGISHRDRWALKNLSPTTGLIRGKLNVVQMASNRSRTLDMSGCGRTGSGRDQTGSDFEITGI